MEIFLGIMEDKLSIQLANCGFSDKDLEHFDMDNSAINRLIARGMLTSAEAEKARRRLLKKIKNAQRSSVNSTKQ